MADMEFVHRLQRRQLGLVTRPQALAAGMTPAAIVTKLNRGEWVPVRRGVYASATVQPSAAQAALAAVLTVDGPAWASHLSAGLLWGLRTPPPDEIHVLTLANRRVRLPGVVHHRTDSIPLADVRLHGAVPVTSVARTLVDSLPWLGEAGFGKAVDDAKRRSLLSYGDLDRCHADLDRGSRTGRHLVVPGRLVVAKRVAGRQEGGSERELGVLDVLEEAGVRLPEQQVEVTIDGKTYKLDYAYTGEKIYLEFEGWAEHGLIFETFHGDRPRNNRLRLAGWLLLQFTAESTAHDIVHDVTAALARRAA